MKQIRRAVSGDLARIAEIEVFNYRLNFYPIFKSDWFYFYELQVPKRMRHYSDAMSQLWVWDDDAVKGFMQTDGPELKKLFVEPVLQSHSIGGELLEYARAELGIRYLWALEKNVRAIAFYERHGFKQTSDRKQEEGTEEYLIRMEWQE